MPLPGGPCRIIEWGCPSSIARRSAEPARQQPILPDELVERAGRRRVARGAPGRAATVAGAGLVLSEQALHVTSMRRRSFYARAMPLQNRVTPFGEVIVTPSEGSSMPIAALHDAHGCVRDRRNPTRRWIACRLDWGGRRRTPLMAPGKFNELFFLDEATALAAGHRPCGECRYGDYEHLKGLWADLHPGQVGADAIDEQLDAERRDPRTGARRFHETYFDDLPTVRS